MLHSSASFSIYTDDQNQEQIMGLEDFDQSVIIGENEETLDSSGNEFSFSKKDMGFIKEEENEEEDYDDGGVDLRPASPPMYLATGLGIDVSGFDVGGGYDSVGFIDEMMVDDPSTSPLFLRNYVNSLWSEGKLLEAEEQSYRATITFPENGEILMQYALLVWELHHDQAIASSYFERAAEVAPNDSNILAARAKFLWELEDDEEDEIMISKEEIIEPLDSPQHNTAMVDVLDPCAADIGESDLQEYYVKMLDENPVNPLLLKNYAHFLLQFKADLQGAEEYYHRAIQADPGDGEALSEYAKLVWDLHHDYNKASNYFGRAIEACPTDSYILGAYASFLWENDEQEDEEEEGANKNGSQLPSLETVAISVGNV